MSLLEQVRSFVARLSPEAVCDDCISEKLGASAGQHIDRMTLELAGSNEFERRKGPCSLCGGDKLVIRKA